MRSPYRPITVERYSSVTAWSSAGSVMALTHAGVYWSWLHTSVWPRTSRLLSSAKSNTASAPPKVQTPRWFWMAYIFMAFSGVSALCSLTRTAVSFGSAI